MSVQEWSCAAIASSPGTLDEDVIEIKDNNKFIHRETNKIICEFVHGMYKYTDKQTNRSVYRVAAQLKRPHNFALCCGRCAKVLNII